MTGILIMVLTLFGAVFMLIAAIGIVRLPDLFMRMSANTKSTTLGAGMVLLAASLFFDDVTITSRAVAVIVFLFLTSPVAAHMIGRAAYFDGVPLWKGTLVDDLKGRYDPKTHDLEAPNNSQKESKKS